MDTQTMATEAAQWFERAWRGEPGDGTEYVRVKDGAPAWVGDLCYEAHGGIFPDDWRYACIAAAVSAIAEGSDEDEGGDFADSQVDAYTGARVAWLASHGSRAGYCDTAADEYGTGTDAGIIDRIGLGQYLEADEVYGLVWQYLDNRADEMDDDDDYMAKLGPYCETCGDHHAPGAHG